MTTRLDRLILLLDTGSTQSVRSTAAKQLGEIQKQHPEELHTLLDRISAFLKNKTWETRTAASLAIEAIAENVPLWSPVNGNTTKDITGMSFDTLSMETVVMNGTQLAGSAGKEYDVELSSMTPKERIAFQKKQLKQRLGLASFDDMDFFDEVDVKMESPKAEPPPPVQEEPQLSARERNRLKRKNRLGKEAPRVEKKPKVKEESVVVEHKKEVVTRDENAWPFESICEKLALDLFSPNWEIRHGGALGLKAILKVHALGAGRYLGLTKECNDHRNIRWLEDVSIRLLCVLALDRFADFVGDHAVLPVREIVAQTLAVVMQNAPISLCLQVVNKGFLPMIFGEHVRVKWEVRHSALIGLKYWMAVRQDLLNQVAIGPGMKELPAFKAIMAALNDSDDDVKSVAASALIPISDFLVESFSPEKVYETIVLSLWNCLQDLDDLTAATSFVMDLLANLITKKQIVDVISQKKVLATFVPRIYPFFRHPIVSVRIAVIRTLSALSQLQSPDWVTCDLIRLIYQNFVIEEKSHILDATLDLALSLHTQVDAATLNPLFSLVTSPIGTSLNTGYFVQYTSKHEQSTYNISPSDKAMFEQDLTIVTVNEILYGRLLGCKALAHLLAPDQMSFLKSFIHSGWASHRLFVACILFDCAIPQDIYDLLFQYLSDANSGATILFSELIPTFTKLYKECQKLSSTPLPPMPTESTATCTFNLQVAEQVLAEAPASELKNRTTVTLESFKQLQLQMNTRVAGSFSFAISHTKTLPAKLNPVIRSLVNGIKTEENPQLQSKMAFGLAEMIELNASHKPETNEKLVKNICAILCSDTSHVLSAAAHPDELGILSHKEAAAVKKVKMDELGLDNVVDDVNQEANSIASSGAKETLLQLASLLNQDLFSRVPKLLQLMSEPFSSSPSSVLELQQLVDALYLIEVVSPVLTLDDAYRWVDPVCSSLCFPKAVVRHHAARAMGSLCKRLGTKAMMVVLDRVLPLVNDSNNDINRQGSVECIHHIVVTLQDDVLPFLVFLIVPLLGRMSDSNEKVRYVATNVFAQLVKLAPLESGIPNPSDFSAEMIEKKIEERKFIGQLIGTEKVQSFSLPVPIKAELRPYQKDGVNWLAFLNRYGLHGVLADDMGLGKTLQTICMMSSDHYNRAEKYKATKQPDVAHCPSLVVCPSTLTGHWFFEIKKYADFMKPIIYQGDKASRESLRKQLRNYDVVIISYEVLRNDIDALSKYRFNYCTLDEGHIIKNPSTKLTKAVKSVSAFHRLILSGTPIQVFKFIVE